jgi:hypothetical protein
VVTVAVGLELFIDMTLIQVIFKIDLTLAEVHGTTGTNLQKDQHLKIMIHR